MSYQIYFSFDLKVKKALELLNMWLLTTAKSIHSIAVCLILKQLKFIKSSLYLVQFQNTSNKID